MDNFNKIKNRKNITYEKQIQNKKRNNRRRGKKEKKSTQKKDQIEKIQQKNELNTLQSQEFRISSQQQLRINKFPYDSNFRSIVNYDFYSKIFF